MLLGVSLAWASGAYGATLVQTETFSFVPNDGSTLTFSQFDTQGGTRVLSSVFIEVEFTKSGGSYSVDNESASGATVTLTHQVTGSLDSALNLQTTTGFLGAPASSLRASSVLTGVTLGADDGDSASNMDPSGDDYFRFEPADLTKATSGFMSNTIQFEGTGTFDITFDAEQTVSITGLGGASQAFSPSAVNGFIRVSYTYLEPVPEPSAAMLGSFGVLALLRRRRRF